MTTQTYTFDPKANRWRASNGRFAPTAFASAWAEQTQAQAALEAQAALQAQAAQLWQYMTMWQDMLRGAVMESEQARAKRQAAAKAAIQADLRAVRYAGVDRIRQHELKDRRRAAHMAHQLFCPLDQLLAERAANRREKS